MFVLYIVMTMDNAKKIKNDIEAQGHQVDNDVLRQTFILPAFEKGKEGPSAPHLMNAFCSMCSLKGMPRRLCVVPWCYAERYLKIIYSLLL